MSKKHEKKYFINILIGFVLVTIGIFTIIYLIFANERKFDWISWAIVLTLIINTGLLFLGRGLVHKVKADLIRRQKHKAKAEAPVTQHDLA